MKKRNYIITSTATILSIATFLASAFITTFAGTTYAYSQCKQCGMLANVTTTTTYPNANEMVHQVREYIVITCSRDHTHVERLERTRSEKHTVVNNVCTGCGYRVH